MRFPRFTSFRAGWLTAHLAAVIFLMVAFPARAGLPYTRWIWTDGAASGQPAGVYGTIGVPASTNQPGGRQGAAKWKDAQGNLWLFGGLGIDAAGATGRLADLWKFDVSTGQWTFVKGTSVVDSTGVYTGPVSGRRPGSRYRAACWTDLAGRFWLFGGDGFAASGSLAGLNDLWMFDPATTLWQWVGGTNQRNHEGVYGSIGQPGTSNVPPNRAGAVTWVDSAGLLWLYGGALVPVVGPGYPKLNDLWRYDISKNQWTWMKGTNQLDQPGVYGTLGAPHSNNRPGARYLAHSWTDAQGRLWLFGGFGRTDANGSGSTNDLWRYDPQANVWAWIKGGKLYGQVGSFGLIVDPQPSNTPGGMMEGATWTDERGDLWLYGGSGFSAGNDYGAFSALWRYNVASNLWTWMNGTKNVDDAPVFGTLGSHSPGNVNTPGGKVAATAWAGSANRAWIFGGTDVGYLTYAQALWENAELFGIFVSRTIGPLGPNATAGFGLTEINTPVEQTFTLLNSGLTALGGLNVVIEPVQGGDFTLLTPPAATLAPGESTTFIVRFSPTSASIHRATIRIDDHGELAPFAIAASGTGQLPAVQMAITPEWVWEDAATPLVYTFTRTGTTADSLTVNFSASGEAAFGIDYTVAGAATFSATAGTLVIPAGAASASVQITPIADTVAEEEEIVRLNLETGAYSAGWPDLGEGAIASEELVSGGRDRRFFPTFERNTFSVTLLAVAAQPDGKILVGGGFDTVNGQARNNLARLNADGTLDPSFNAALPSTPIVYGIAPQADGGIIVAGGPNGTARLLADGAADPDFTPLPAYAPIYALAVQPDGRILIGGFFTAIHGVPRSRIARLHANGTLDESFNPGQGANGDVDCMVVQADGRILVGGRFTTFGGLSRAGVVRLEANGVVDSSFDPGTGVSGAAATVACIGLQADGRIVIAGEFLTFNGEPRNKIARLLPGGSLDPDFDATTGTDYGIETLALQADGKILLGGYFDTLNGHAVPGLGRLNSDGTFDATFQATSLASNSVDGLALLAGGAIVTIGQPGIGEQARTGIALRANDPAPQTLRPFNGTVVDWLRGGSAPEFTRTTFDLSTDDGAHWTPLGDGERITGGWRAVAASIPMTGHLRARGYASGGYHGSSASVHEQIAAFTRAPEIVVEAPLGVFHTDGETVREYGMRVYRPGVGLIDLSQFFRIHNVGNADLTDLSLVIDGDHPTDFPQHPVTSAPILPGGYHDRRISFNPQALGPRQANLHIFSSDADEASFDIALTGTGITRREGWRYTYFGDIAGTGKAADDADFDGDGDSNNLEYYTGSDPADPNSRYRLRIETVEGQPTSRRLIFPALLREFGQPLPGPTLTVQYRNSLDEGGWETLPGAVQYGLPDSFIVDTDATGPARFYRILITAPPGH